VTQEKQKPAGEGKVGDDAVNSLVFSTAAPKSVKGVEAQPKPLNEQTPKSPAGTAEKKTEPMLLIDSKKLDTAFAVIERIIDIVKGTKDVRNRLSAILDPKNPKTSSKLNAEQVNMLIDSYWFYNTYGDLYKGVKTLADEMVLDMLSLDGHGVEKAIQLTAAIEQSKLLNTLYGSTQEQRTRLPSFKKEATKQ